MRLKRGLLVAVGVVGLLVVMYAVAAQSAEGSLYARYQQARCERQCDAWLEELGPTLAAWDDTASLANQTPRMGLSMVIRDLQALRREAEALPAPACALYAYLALVGHMDHTIDGFAAFMAQDDDAIIDDYFRQSTIARQNFRRELMRIRE